MDEVRVYFTTNSFTRQQCMFFTDAQNRLLKEDDAQQHPSLDGYVSDKRLAQNDALQSAKETKEIIRPGKNVVITGSQLKPPGYGLTPYRVRDARVISEEMFRGIVQKYVELDQEYVKEKDELRRIAEEKIKRVEADRINAERTLKQPELHDIVLQSLATKGLL